MLQNEPTFHTEAEINSKSSVVSNCIFFCKRHMHSLYMENKQENQLFSIQHTPEHRSSPSNSRKFYCWKIFARIHYSTDNKLLLTPTDTRPQMHQWKIVMTNKRHLHKQPALQKLQHIRLVNKFVIANYGMYFRSL